MANTTKYSVDENGRTVYPLKRPITVGTETVTELRFRAPKAKDMRSFPLEGRTIGHVLDIVGKLCGQPTVVIDELSAEDLEEVSSIAGVF